MASLEQPPHWFVVGGRKRAILAYAPPARRTCMRNRRASIQRADALGPWVRARKVLRISSVFCSLQPFFAIEMASAAAAARSPEALPALFKSSWTRYISPFRPHGPHL